MGMRSKRQRGSILALFSIALFSLLAMAGLAMDFGHVWVGRSSLQNALDAAALSAAKTLDSGASTLDASNDGDVTFSQHISGVLAGSGISPNYEYSETLTPFVGGAEAPDARYVRVSVDDLAIPTTLLRMIPGISDSLAVAGTAVAGPIPIGNSTLGQTCDLVPLIACADVDEDGNYDGDCSDGTCFGYDVVDGDTQVSDTVILKTGARNSDDWDVGAGNFQLAELACGSGGACVRSELAGIGTGCVDNGDPNIHTKPGDTVGPSAQGFNTRFGDYAGPIGSDEAPPDVVTTPGTYYDYLTRVGSSSWDNIPVEKGGIGVHDRRLLAVQIGNCTGTTNGSGTVERLGIGCFFMTAPASHSGNTQEIVGQFVGECQADGDIAEDPGAGTSTTTHKIVLYKDPDANDS